MHIGAHWGNWGTAIAALIVGVVLIWKSRRDNRWNWTAAGALALVLAASMFINGWRIWPMQTAEHFISMVNHGRQNEVRAMLSESGQWTVSEDGGVTILADNSSRVSLSDAESHLVASSGPDNASVPRPTWSGFFAARHDFQMASPTGKAVTIYCTAEQGRVRIRRAEAIEQ